MSEQVQNPDKIDPAMVAQVAANVIVRASVEEAQISRFDALLNPNDDVPFNVEDAAVRMPKNNGVPARVGDRIGYFSKPSEDQIAHAAEHGYDLTAQNKYHA